MKKVAIFTEGQGELIFVRRLLTLAIRPDKLSFECLSLRANKFYPVPYKVSPKTAQIHFLLVNIGNDEKVTSAIAEREENLVNKGYNRIIGLRDMYSKEYCKRSSIIDNSVTQSFIEAHELAIQQMSNPDRIFIIFAIMELEAWLLAMYNLFAKIHPDLTCTFIQSKLDFDLETINPQAEFFHPSVQFGHILGLVGEKYKKSQTQMESILSKMDTTDIDDAQENKRCSNFAAFLAKIKNFTDPLTAEAR